MCDEKFRDVQENELQNLKTSFGHSNVEDLRSNGDDEFVWKPLNVKILLCLQGKLDKGVVSIELTVVCDADYPEVEPQFFLDNGKGLSDEFVDKLTNALKIQIRNRGNTLLELAQTVQKFLNEDELLAVPSPTQSIRYQTSRDECVQHQTSKILHFIDAGKKIQQGCCLGHSSKGCIAFSGIDLETGQLLYITEWFITNTQLKVQCEVNGCDMQTICRKHGVDEIVANINEQSAQLTQLKHKNLIHYEGVHCVKEQEGIRIYLAQDFVLGNSVANISNSFEWCEENASMVAIGVVQALLYLHSNGVSHNLLCDTAVFIDNCSNIRVTDFMLVPYLQRLIGEESLCINDDLTLLGTLIESLCPTPSSVMSDFIENCRRTHCDNVTINDLLEEPFLKPSHSILNDNYDDIREKCSVDINTAISSRFENDFTQLEKLSVGAFGEVFKVRHIVDQVEYAIKKLLLEKNSKKLYKSITKEVELLSGIHHENIVRYNASWIEARPKSEDINADGDTSECSLYVFENEDDNTSDDEDLEWDDSMGRFLYIQMEYCGGNTLRKAIDNGLYTDNDCVWRYFREICEGLAYVHQQGVIHRDLKPTNIFIGAGDQIKIGGFGLATPFRRPQELLSQLKYGNGNFTTFVDTPLYMPPEFTSLDVQYDHKIDVYSLGIILFEMSYKPFTTDLERYTIIKDLREPSVTIPNVLLNNVVYTQNVKVIKCLLQHPCKRPSIEELLKSDLVRWNKQKKGPSRFKEDFTYLRELGNGAFGEVFKVRHNVDKVEYAIKKISLEDNSREFYKSMTREVQLLSGLNHEYIVRYNTSWFEAKDKSEDKNKDNNDSSKWYTLNQREFENDLEFDDSKERLMYIQMEYCGGNTLRKAIDNGLYTDNDRVWRYFREICEGLAYVHQQEIIHRDLKPANIFIGARDQIKIGDFGLATRFPRPQELLSESKYENGNLSVVGTRIYRAVELKYQDGQDVQYDNKVDVYSLGIILFEMSHKPMDTESEYLKIINNLRKRWVKIPKVLLRSVNAKVIKWLIKHNPRKRPSIEKLLKSKLVPPAERDITEFREKIRNTIDNPQSNQYKYLVEQCMAQESIESYRTEAVQQLGVEFVKLKIIILNIFQKHGGIEVVPPLLTACSKDHIIDKHAVRLMTKTGRTIFLPHNLRLPFVHYVVSSQIIEMRRFAIGHVYYEEEVLDCHPKQMYECDFDIITRTLGNLSVDAELLSIAFEFINEISREIPALQELNISFRINHTTLLQEILKHFEIPTDKWDKLFDELQQYSNLKITLVQLKHILTAVVKNEEIVTVLLNLLHNELPFFGQSTTITETIFQNTLQMNDSELSVVKAAIGELETVVTLAQSHGVSCAFNLVFSLAVGSVPTKSGRILWQMVAEIKRPPNREKRYILAAGERYDSFFSESDPLSGAGLTISLNSIIDTAIVGSYLSHFRYMGNALKHSQIQRFAKLRSFLVSV